MNVGLYLTNLMISSGIKNGLEKTVFIKSLLCFVVIQVIVATSHAGANNITGIITARKDGLVKLEFQPHGKISPEIGDPVTCSTLIRKITVKTGTGVVSKVENGYVWVTVESGRINLKHRCEIYVSQSPIGYEVPSSQEQAPGTEYPETPLDVVKAFMKYFLAGDIINGAQYISPAERKREIKSFQEESQRDLSAYRLDQFTFQITQKRDNQATVVAKVPWETEAVKLGNMIRIDGKWYITYGGNRKKSAPGKMMFDKKDNWLLKVPLDWEEDFSSNEDWAIYRPASLNGYELHIRVKEYPIPEAAITPEQMRKSLQASGLNDLILVEGPRYETFAGYTRAIFAHISARDLIYDLNLPKNGERWNWFGYDLVTEHARYHFIAVCRDDYCANHLKELKEIIKSVTIK